MIRLNFLSGFIFGLFFWSLSIFWIYDAINFYGAGNVLSFFITTSLICYLSIYTAVFCKLITYFRNSKITILLLPSIFFILEWVRSWMISGFPWLNLGIIVEPFWGFLPYVGASGTSFFIILFLCLLWYSLFSDKDKGQKTTLKRIISFAAAGLIFFIASINHKDDNSIIGKINIGIVQPINNDINLLKNITNTMNKADVVLWPEAVGWFDNKLVIDQDIKPIILGGFFIKEEDKVFSSMINLQTKERYDKRNLVPFGEFQPFGEILRSVNKFFNIPNSNFTQGLSKQKRITVAGYPFAGLICWELSFNNTFTDRVKDSGIIFHISNDSWYGDKMPLQHLKHARARAVESQKWVIRSTTDGLSQIISPFGDSSEIIPRGQFGNLIHYNVPIKMKNTIYVKYGDLPLLIVSFLTLIFGIFEKKRHEV